MSKDMEIVVLTTETAAAVGRLRETKQQQDYHRREGERAAGEVADAVRAALQLGVPAAAVAQLLGLSRYRVYQIRDGRR